MDKVVNIFTAPAEAFRALREKPTFLLPVAVLILANVILVMWYYNVVDVMWLMETSLEASNAEIPADQREQVLERIAATPRMVFAGSSAVAVSLVVLVLMLLAAMYLSLVSMFTNDGFRFRNWFSLVAWSSLPVVLAVLASMVNLAVGDPTFLAGEELNPLSFRNLLGLDVSGTGFSASLLQYADPTSIWSLALMIVGYRQWTGHSIEKSALIVAAPLLVIVVVGLVVSA